MIIPAIDLMQGKAVQLKQGKEKILEVNNFEPLIEEFKIFPQVNLIDLDAAMSKGSNKQLIKELCQKLNANVGGGIRSLDLAFEYLRAGAKKIIVGTSATKEFLKNLPKERVIVALDTKQGKIAIEGWTKLVDSNLAQKIKELEPYCSQFLVTNINVEGLCEGTNLEFFKSLQNLTKNKIMVAGGISTYQEIKAIDKLGFDQVIGTAYYNGTINLNQALIKTIDFEKQQNLVPTITRNKEGQVLMLAYSSKESLTHSLKTKQATYYSRSRKELWTKGLTSGNTQELLEVSKDCDSDTLLFTVNQTGSACHTQSYSCFEEKQFNFQELINFLKNKIENKQDSSYTYQLSKNKKELSKKILEEAQEITAANTKEEKIWEIADLLYFVSVFMATNNITMPQILNELSLRHKVNQKNKSLRGK
jgi:phosphoribosyl-AMP cyclohydrolase / phosphoribosyl-ATP pyrophosphohydrolase